jgi:hypothetical protein
MKVINLFGGPGIGKSAIASGVFFLLKFHNINCEFVSEYAKDLVWDERYVELKNQLPIFSEQYKRITRLQGKVDIVITDSPIILPSIYGSDESEFFHSLVLDKFMEFDNINFLVSRYVPYSKIGRYQTESEAFNFDYKLKYFLDNKGIQYDLIKSNIDSINCIVERLLNFFNITAKYKVQETVC